MRFSHFGILLCASAVLLTGCGSDAPPTTGRPPPPVLPPKQVEAFLRSTIWEQVDLTNAEPLRVSGFGLVVNLNGTGDTRAPNTVREYMIKQMQKHGIGSSVQPGFEKVSPEAVLNDKLHRTAIVRVDGFIPPGARKDRPFDVQVSALENSNTTSLHRGQLYQTDLGPRGADPFNPGSAGVTTWARASGPVFVNPAYALEEVTDTQAPRASLRTGVVMGRGIAVEDRPLILKLRSPERRMARMVERRIQERFQDSKISAAKNETDIWVYVPASYGEDWERFAGVVTHLYFNASNDFAILKARQLAEIARTQRENAPLMDISYCWEAMTPVILPEIRPLYTSDSPDVAYAAARAGAFLGDSGAEETLARIARTDGNAFQINSVRVLGQLPRTARVVSVLHELLDTNQVLLRIEAYKSLINIGDTSIYSQSVREKFILDIVPSEGSPIVYASRVGKPRIAVIGKPPQIALPILYFTMQNHFSITANNPSGAITMFYRGGSGQREQVVESMPDLAVCIARLGGGGPPDAKKFDFGYGDVVGILQQLSDRKLLVESDPPSGVAPRIAAFQMQTLPGVDDPILSAPPIMVDEQRPTTLPTGTPSASFDGSGPDLR